MDKNTAGQGLAGSTEHRHTPVFHYTYHNKQREKCQQDREKKKIKEIFQEK